MVKTIIIITLLIIPVLSFQAYSQEFSFGQSSMNSHPYTTTQETESEWKTITDGNARMVFSYPINWRISHIEDPLGYRIVPEDQSVPYGIQIAVVSVYPTVTTFQEAVNNFVSHLQGVTYVKAIDANKYTINSFKPDKGPIGTHNDYHVTDFNGLIYSIEFAYAGEKPTEIFTKFEQHVKYYGLTPHKQQELIEAYHEKAMQLSNNYNIWSDRQDSLQCSRLSAIDNMGPNYDAHGNRIYPSECR
jgi:hypothetical protein